MSEEDKFGAFMAIGVIVAGLVFCLCALECTVTSKCLEAGNVPVDCEPLGL